MLLQAIHAYYIDHFVVAISSIALTTLDIVHHTAWIKACFMIDDDFCSLVDIEFDLRW